MNILKIIALILCIIGSVNWGLIGLLNFNLVDTLFGVGSLISIIIYILVGVSGFISILTLIDLIEKDDYVNGRKVKHIAMFEGFPDYPKLIFVDETHLIPDDTCENEDIKTILTHEQFEANCYKVGGEDE